MHRKLLILATLAAFTLIAACEKDPSLESPAVDEPAVEQPDAVLVQPTLPDQLYDYAGYEFPEYFTSSPLLFFSDNSADNPTTDEGSTLGRVLFYDVRLSANNTISCGSCHFQELAFSDGVQFSTGFEGQQTPRNSMGLTNGIFARDFFWDLRADNLEIQTLMPIQDHIEMGMKLEVMEEKLAAEDYYPPLFEAAFGTPEVTSDRISKALAQFVRSMVSYQSKFDEGMQSGFANYTEQELLGKDLFYNAETACNFCHQTVNFATPTPQSNGLDEFPTDIGVGNVSANPTRQGTFKVPTLRNIELTGPYMHDGRFETLEEVVEHYNSGIQPHENLHHSLTSDNIDGGTPKRMNLTAAEKAALVAFMKTLTDQSFLTDPKWSDPFQ